MQCAQQLFIPQHTQPSCDAVRTTVFHSTTNTTIKWCSEHSSFSFHNTHHHHVMQCAQQFFIPHHTPPSSDAVRTTVFYSTSHTTITWCSAHSSFGFHNTHPHHVITWCNAHNSFSFRQHTPSSCDAVSTVVLDSTTHTHITWCSAHNSFSFHNTHHHQVMQCAQQFFIPHHTPPSRDAVRTVVLDSTTHTHITWCSEHNSFGFHNKHHHHVMQCEQQFLIQHQHYYPHLFWFCHRHLHGLKILWDNNVITKS